ncbi:hypothetical protein AK812_SmicGene28774 [Symbiodinium microadriaticum]|uniref:Magnesium-dependent phosphatase 1 n=1 Tax=Symbiodinium microadriaticum TaxID=2951 RepID=A0A1Q9D3I9_SYMMI|nr:hypothetical protein AK812_SmicGene28774 [Symbiodinium microadriaticum]
MWGTFKDAPLEQIPVVEESFSNLALFRWLVRAIRKRSGEVAIATFGRKDVAGKAMQFALGEDHGIFITTPADYPDPCQAEVKAGDGAADRAEVVSCPEGSAWLGNKNRQLAALAARFGVSAKDMMLLDDDLNNIQEAAKAGVTAQHCPTGLNKVAIRKAAETLGLAATPPNSD